MICGSRKFPVVMFPKFSIAVDENTFMAKKLMVYGLKARVAIFIRAMQNWESETSFLMLVWG